MLNTIPSVVSQQQLQGYSLQDQTSMMQVQSQVITHPMWVSAFQTHQPLPNSNGFLVRAPHSGSSFEMASIVERTLPSSVHSGFDTYGFPTLATHRSTSSRMAPGAIPHPDSGSAYLGSSQHSYREFGSNFQSFSSFRPRSAYPNHAHFLRKPLSSQTAPRSVRQPPPTTISFVPTFSSMSAIFETASSEDKENFGALKPNFKTRLCRHFSNGGMCPKGDRCGFAHGHMELRTQPMLSSAPFPVPVAQRHSTVPSGYLSSEVSTHSSSSPSQDDKTLLKYKTKLCLHFRNTGRCPKRDACGFAHGAHELQDSEETLAKKSLNAEHKTKLCEHFAKGGSQDCPNRWKCEFVHPMDKEYYLEFYAETEEFHQKKQEFKSRVQAEHRRKTLYTPVHEEFAIEARILRMVKAWNNGHPKGPHYHDLHGLTVFMAEKYVVEVIEEMVANGVEEARIETGRGNNSAKGIAAIRTKLLTKYQGHKGAHFAPEVGNDGILVLTFPKST